MVCIGFLVFFLVWSTLGEFSSKYQLLNHALNQKWIEVHLELSKLFKYLTAHLSVIMPRTNRMLVGGKTA